MLLNHKKPQAQKPCGFFMPNSFLTVSLHQQKK